MQRLLCVIFLVSLGSFGWSVLEPLSFVAEAQTAKAAAGKSDAQIKQEIIRQSIASFSGSCPCPFNTDRAGRSCGRRSAYSRPGGAAPFCYEGDVTQKMVNDHRVVRGEKRPPVVPVEKKPERER